MEDGKLTVRAVERALDILLCFTDSSDLSLTEIASRVSLHKSTVHRLLASLEGKGFVIRDASSDKYRLGFRIWELSANMTHSDDPALILLPEMERLRDQLDETISLYVSDGLERVRVQAVQSNQAIRRVAPIGARMPLHVGASSKILVAFAEPEVQQSLLASPAWPAGLDKASFRQQLAEAKSLGFATSVEEREPGAAAVAVPILNRAHRLVAALAVSGPSNRLTLEKMMEHAPVLMEAARRMGKMIK
ncbi:IclR family transcriptional regulator [Paenibacillus doosanensis]|uniref:HTH-type transcriptional regulator KipR n=1 Tax=Paenibacillus konkukensis TaxID=2020716 RepID=A0ABY4RQT1_9BACL|nr:MULTISPECIES: IclR family transcriptional regulator [Paenibacillus]MCS7464649.1 IclR family transcriptional regulator [Paenibacillus doosanensis]UQZ84049.1 HTH-type transcriptional regulator KipR [Paenibacillus konkukensis]